MTQKDKQRLLNHEAELGKYALGDELAKLDRLHVALSNDFGDSVPGIIEGYIDNAVSTATSAYFTGVLELAVSAAMLDKAVFYSATPVQVGTWVDGSPVYRAAIDVLCADVDETTYGDLILNGGASYQMSDAISVIDCRCAFQYDTHRYVCEPVISEFGVNFVLPDGVTLPEDQTDCTDERFIGFVEYIVL